MPEDGTVVKLRNARSGSDCSAPYELPGERLNNRVKVVSITSGKGGVGKTNTVINLAIALSRAGQRVTLLDADFGLGNVDIMLGLCPEFSLEHVLRGLMGVEEILIRGPSGVTILPAGSGATELAHLSNEQEAILHRSMASLAETTDVILLDTAAGISDNVTQLLYASHEVVLVTSPEPTAIVDAYAIIKILARHDPQKTVKLLVNWVESAQTAQSVYRQLATASYQFLRKEVDFLGFIQKDLCVQEAIRLQQPLLDAFPESDASRCFLEIAARMKHLLSADSHEGVSDFLKKLLRRSSFQTEGRVWGGPC